MSKNNYETYFITFYVKSKLFLTHISQSISYYAYKVKEKFKFDYSHINVKEPCDDLARLTIYEEEENKKKFIFEDNVLEEDDSDDIEDNFTINQLS